MAEVLSVSDSDDQALTVSTTHTVATDAAAGAYVFQVDLTNLQAGDDLYVYLVGPLFEGGADVVLAVGFADDAVVALSEAAVLTIEAWAPHGVIAKIRQDAGTTRTVRWTLSKVV